MTTTAEKNMALLRAAYQSLESGDLDACVELLTEDFIANVPGLPDHGREIWRQGAQAMLEAFPDLGGVCRLRGRKARAHHPLPARQRVTVDH